MKRFWTFKRGQRFFVGATVLTKTGLLGCADCFGNLFFVLPWSKFVPYVELPGMTSCCAEAHLIRKHINEQEADPHKGR